MTRPTKLNPERGDANKRLLEAALGAFRRQGYSATSVADLCSEAEVTKGAFFHHFASKEAIGIAAAAYWSETTSRLFAEAPYRNRPDALERLLGYVDYRRSLIEGGLEEFTCLAGTMTQELYGTHPAIRDACAAAIFGHAATLEADIAEAIELRKFDTEWTARSLAEHMQAVLQGAFILAKAKGENEIARDSVEHLKRYIQLLFQQPETQKE